MAYNPSKESATLSLMGAYWAILTALADGVVDFEAGSESKTHSALLVSWFIAFATILFLLFALIALFLLEKRSSILICMYISREKHDKDIL